MKKIFIIFMGLAFIINFSGYSRESTIVVHEGESIQDAINSAMPGDKIIIEGTFHESVVVNKSVIIEGRNAIVYGTNGSVFNITANAILRNLSIARSDASHAVVYAEGNAVIERCNISHGRYGIVAKNGITVYACNVSEAGGGIVIKNDSVISSCTFYKCGIAIQCYGDNNQIFGDNAHYCGVALYMENASHNIIEECHFYKNNNNECGIFMLSSHYNEIRKCDISYVSFGIRMMRCNGNVIEQTNLHDMRYGVEYEDCNDCYIYRSSLYNNRFGIEVTRCRGMRFNYNDLENKMYNLHAKFSYCDARHNYWGSIFPSKIKNEGSIVLTMPWLIKPIHGIKKERNDEIEKSMEEKRYIIPKHEFKEVSVADFDPLVDIKVAFIVKRVRSFDMGRYKVSISIDGKENESVFENDVEPGWRVTQDVDDSKQIAEIKIKIGREEKQIHYDLATGNWYGDDWLGDENGYGHILFKKYEIWFDVTYNDYDGDGLTYWEEENIYHTSPYINNSMDDVDKDGIPFWWEDKYGLNPLKSDNVSIDYDKDGLTTLQEYYMASNLSDPFAKDIFLEIDYMHDYKPSQTSVELLCNAFALHNITLHVFIDDELPLKDRLYYDDLKDIYWKYFLDGNIDSIKHGVFHYEVMGKYSSIPRGGHAFVGWDNLDSFVLGGAYINKWRSGEARKVAYASLSMHELGHTLGLFEYTFPGIDNESCNAPWMRGYWIYRNYKSCLNYRYAFQLVDYSDGRHGRNDFDDWDNIDLTFFKNSYYYP